MNRRSNITAKVLGSLVLALATPAISQSSPADGPWSGQIQCQLHVQQAGYTRDETQTWTLAGNMPVGKNGDMQLYPATWSATGQGGLQKTLGMRASMAQWSLSVPPTPATIAMFIRAQDKQFVIRIWQRPVPAPNTVRGTSQLAENGVVRPGTINSTAREWTLPWIVTDPRSSLSGKFPVPTESLGADLMPTGPSLPSAVCVWQFSRPSLTNVAGGAAGAAGGPGAGAAAGAGASVVPGGGAGATNTSLGHGDDSPTEAGTGPAASGSAGAANISLGHGDDSPTEAGTGPAASGSAASASTQEAGAVVGGGAAAPADPANASSTGTVGGSSSAASSTQQKNPHALPISTTVVVPALSQVTPNQADIGTKNLNLTLTGTFTHFAQGTTVELISQAAIEAALGRAAASYAEALAATSLVGGGGGGGGAIPAGQSPPSTLKALSVSVISPTQVVALFNIDPPAFPGAYSVVAKTGSEQAALIGGFTLRQPNSNSQPKSSAPKPKLTQVAPNSVDLGATNVKITITGSGTHFATGTTVELWSQENYLAAVLQKIHEASSALNQSTGPSGGTSSGPVAGPSVNAISVAVPSTTIAVATVNIDSSLAPGPYVLVATTGSEQAVLSGDFTLTSAGVYAAPANATTTEAPAGNPLSSATVTPFMPAMQTSTLEKTPPSNSQMVSKADSNSPATACDHPYLPLRAGATWTYSAPSGTQIWKVRSVVGDQNAATAVVEVTAGSTSATYNWHCDKEGIRFYGIGFSGVNATISNETGVALLAADKFLASAAWENSYTFTVSTQGASVATTVAGSNAASDVTPQTTSLGTFDTITVISNQTLTSNVNHEVASAMQATTFAKGVGILKSQSIVNGQTSYTELTSYQIP